MRSRWRTIPSSAWSSSPCALVYGWGLWSGKPAHPAWLIAAGVVLAITLTIPRILAPLQEEFVTND